ncbi:MAG: Ycf48-like protein [Ignavibacteria bacterium]|nr:Ycf48-like protein [Ignavibacteria bacterium]
MKKVISVIIIFLAFQNNGNAQSGWQIQQSSVSLNLKAVCFINSNTGWTAGDSGVILKTTNGGLNWIRQNSNTNKPLSHITFIDSQNGVAAGSSYEYNPWCFERLVMLATTNGGTVWNVIFDQLSSKLHDLISISSDMYAAYEGRDIQCLETTGFITKSLNGGYNWLYSLGTNYGYKSISFINVNTGWATGEYTTDFGLRVKQLIKTTDSGLNWFTIRSDTNFFVPESKLRFYSPSTGYKISGSLIKTTDGGYNWLLTDSMMTLGVRSFAFLNPDTGWCAVSGGNIIRTNNGGTSWSLQTNYQTHSLNSIYMINKDTGYIACSGGVILKTITGGLTGTASITENVPSTFKLYQNFPNPFNPSTKIIFDIYNNSNRTGKNVVLIVYDVLGNETALLVNESLTAGSYEIDFPAKENNGENNLSGGVYFYKLTVGNFSETKRMIYLK